MYCIIMACKAVSCSASVISINLGPLCFLFSDTFAYTVIPSVVIVSWGQSLTVTLISRKNTDRLYTRASQSSPWDFWCHKSPSAWHSCPQMSIFFQDIENCTDERYADASRHSATSGRGHSSSGISGIAVWLDRVMKYSTFVKHDPNFSGCNWIRSGEKIRQ